MRMKRNHACEQCFARHKMLCMLVTMTFSQETVWVFNNPDPSLSSVNLPDVVVIGLGQFFTSIPQSLKPLVLLLDAGKIIRKAIDYA